MNRFNLALLFLSSFLLLPKSNAQSTLGGNIESPNMQRMIESMGIPPEELTVFLERYGVDLPANKVSSDKKDIAKPTLSTDLEKDKKSGLNSSVSSFFEGSAEDIWNQGIEFNSSEALKILPNSDDKKDQNPKAKNNKFKDLEINEFRKKLIEKYGDPSEDFPVEADKSAPKPFRAMMDALNYGDHETAMKFARQYSHFLRRYEELTDKATEDIVRARELENLVPARKGTLRDSEEIDYEGYKLSLDKGKNKSLPNSEQGELSPIARELLESEVLNNGTNLEAERARAEEEKRLLKLFAAPEDELRTLARNESGDKVPYVGSGGLALFFFFRQFDQNAVMMLPVLEEIAKKYGKDNKFKIKAFTIDSLNPLEEKALRSKAKVSFPIKSGGELARQLKVNNSPTTVLLSTESGKFIQERGLRGFAYLDELLKIARGQ
jgi:hypothetical protein